MCFSNLILSKESPVRFLEEKDQFLHTFCRTIVCPQKDLTTIGLKGGDYVAISNQLNELEVAIAMGYIVKVDKSYVQVSIERNLQDVDRYKNCVFRIDKLVSKSSSLGIQDNLMKLMEDSDQAHRLRKLIIDKESPRFLITLPKNIAEVSRPILKLLNKVQRKAVLKSLMVKDYLVIKGMPGTGKTSTIVSLVLLMVKLGISVILTSYTHSAIDNILLKLLDHDVNFVRLGPRARIHPNIQAHAFENFTSKLSSVDGLTSFMKEVMVVGTTCLSINHALFKIRKFDFCIVDEASQINQIACMGPLFLARKFILVGDQKQLPPIVINEEARQMGMQESLLERLQTVSNCVELTIQYRMNSEIMRLCNELTYSGALQCASDEIAASLLQLNFSEKDDCSNNWLHPILGADLQNSVLFLNTDHVPKALEAKDKRGQIKNEFEMQLVTTILKRLIECGVSEKDVGIISPYRCQVELILSKLKSFAINSVEVNTIDQYQGRDKDVIVISCVRHSRSIQDKNTDKTILNDERRLNVAITRSKRKLILIGSKSTLSHFGPFQNLLQCLRNDQYIDLPSNFAILPE